MSAGNHFSIRKRAFDLREKEITTTYTVKVGGAGDDFIEDRVINIKDPAANFTVTVANGVYEGQRLLVTFTSDTSSKTATITVTTGTNYSLTAAGDYASLEWVNSTVGWIALNSQET